MLVFVCCAVCAPLLLGLSVAIGAFAQRFDDMREKHQSFSIATLSLSALGLGVTPLCLTCQFPRNFQSFDDIVQTHWFTAIPVFCTCLTCCIFWYYSCKWKKEAEILKKQMREAEIRKSLDGKRQILRYLHYLFDFEKYNHVGEKTNIFLSSGECKQKEQNPVIRAFRTLFLEVCPSAMQQNTEIPWDSQLDQHAVF